MAFFVSNVQTTDPVGENAYTLVSPQPTMTVASSAMRGDDVMYFPVLYFHIIDPSVVFN